MKNELASVAIKIKFWDWWFLRFFGSKRKFKFENKHLDLFGNWRDIARVNFKCIIWVFGVPWVVSKFEKLKMQKSQLWSSIDRIFKCLPLRLTYNIAEAFLKLPLRDLYRHPPSCDVLFEPIESEPKCVGGKNKKYCCNHWCKDKFFKWCIKLGMIILHIDHKSDKSCQCK